HRRNKNPSPRWLIRSLDAAAPPPHRRTVLWWASPPYVGAIFAAAAAAFPAPVRAALRHSEYAASARPPRFRAPSDRDADSSGRRSTRSNSPPWPKKYWRADQAW